MADPQLHPMLEPISWLLGTWTGEGSGIYPTIESFRYGEETRFWHSGKPLLSYLQKTWSLDDGGPLHSESGFWRPQEGGGIEVVVAHGFGVVEISEGKIDEGRIEVTSQTLVSSSSADDVAGIRRLIELDGDAIAYEIDMSAADQPLQRHLTARLHRT
jgi:THAP domain-containing protein 4